MRRKQEKTRVKIVHNKDSYFLFIKIVYEYFLRKKKDIFVIALMINEKFVRYESCFVVMIFFINKNDFNI